MSFGYSTCPECDEHVPYGLTAEHECDRERWLSFQVTRADLKSRVSIRSWLDISTQHAADSNSGTQNERG